MTLVRLPTDHRLLAVHNPPAARSRRALKQMTERLAVAGTAPSGQPGQVPIHGQYEPRAAHAASRDHRLRRHDPFAAALVPIGTPRYLDYLKESARAAITCSASSTTYSTSRRSRRGARAFRTRGFNIAAVLDATIRMMGPLADREGVSIEMVAREPRPQARSRSSG